MNQLYDYSTIGITSTIPVEIIFAAGLKPVDINNIFITSPDRKRLLLDAESSGFPNNICSWIKGIYSIVMSRGIKRVVAVTGGDCSNTIALCEILSRRGIEIINFNYPFDRDRKSLRTEIENLLKRFSVSWDKAMDIKARLDRIREKLSLIDRLTYQEDLVTGFENHVFLVASSDFDSDPYEFEKKIEDFINVAKKRGKFDSQIRLGYLGVPNVFDGFYEHIEKLGARVVFNEIQRQFSMPYGEQDIVDTYLRYTYPYGIEARMEDISEQIKKRKLDGLIHYTQSFCHRQIHDILFRECLPLPILTIEGDRPGPLDGRIAFRVEAFIEMLKQRKREN